MKEPLNWSPANWVNNIGIITIESFKVLRFWLQRYNRYTFWVCSPKLLEALGGQPPRSDIADHLNTILFFSSSGRNRLIIELGTRGGESTRALLAGAAVCDAQVLSVDIEDCSGIRVPFSGRWQFVQANDIEFGERGFTKWCKEHGVEAKIDLLFIDTSHEYRHTADELRVWIPHLADSGVVMLHDTNMGNGVYARMNGTLGSGWDNKRGVMRAVEEYLGVRYDERRFFGDVTGVFRVLHFPWSNGLTILQKQGD